MARAHVVTKVFRKVRQVRVRRTVLELGDGEVDFLLALSRRVSGDPENSPRKYMNRIARALVKSTGMNPSNTDADKLSVPSYESGIWFQDYPDPRGAPKLLP